MQAPSDFSQDAALRPQGSKLARTLLAWFGWQVHFEGLPAKQGVLIVYPHTSNWDFIVLVMAKWALGLQAHFWGKESIFKVPLLGRWMRWLGGIPVLRNSAHGAVGQMVELFVHRKTQDHFFWLALSPEGTRKRTAGWRSGFYQIALRAQVPLGVVTLDYARKQIVVRDFLMLTGDAQHDMSRIAHVVSGAQGLRPLQASPIQLIEKTQKNQ